MEHTVSSCAQSHSTDSAFKAELHGHGSTSSLQTVRCSATLQGINDFCRSIGLTRTGGELPLHIMNYHIGRDLDANSPRTLAVLHPLRLVITNLPQDHLEMVQAKVSPTAAAAACLPHTLRHILPSFAVACWQTEAMAISAGVATKSLVSQHMVTCCMCLQCGAWRLARCLCT